MYTYASHSHTPNPLSTRRLHTKVRHAGNRHVHLLLLWRRSHSAPQLVEVEYEIGSCHGGAFFLSKRKNLNGVFFPYVGALFGKVVMGEAQQCKPRFIRSAQIGSQDTEARKANAILNLLAHATKFPR